LKYDLPEPIFEEVSGSFIITFGKYKISEEIMKGLSERQRIIVEYLKKHEKISRGECMKLLNMSKDTAFREFLTLQKKDILIRHGRGKNVYYTLK